MMTAAVSTIYGVPTKYVSLLILVVQNSALVLTMRYSRIQPGPRYLTSTAVVCSEILKCIICLSVHLHEQWTKPSSSPDLPTLSDDQPPSSHYSLRQLFSDIFSAKSGFLKLLIPAVLYTLQNNLQFVAASNLDAATFQVTYQCKILTTALFAVLLLNQSLSLTKWMSLLILTAGVACVQIPSSTPATTQAVGNYFIGIIAVAIACLCSGFAGVYFEKVLKQSSTHTSIWVRNIQLSVGCLGIAIAGTLMWDGPTIMTKGFFYAYSPIVVGTICIQAAGGLIVAMVIKYADNILKGFATSLSIILSTVASVFIFDFVVTIYFLIGSILVFFATWLYSKPDPPKPTRTEEATPMLEINDAEYDEKDPDHQRESKRFTDDASDVESNAGRSRQGSESRDPSQNRRETRAVSTPNLGPGRPMQDRTRRVSDFGEEPGERKVYDELGYVS
jgi:solute carrier family 35 (UDP-sugar transporter), member A1/2/3